MEIPSLARWILIPILFIACTLLPAWSAEEPPSIADRRAALDELQKAALRYMWEDGDPDTGLAREASFEFEEGRPLAVGGTGFGVAAIVVGVQREWIGRGEAVERLLRIVRFLHDRTPRRDLHGAFPHWLHTETGETIRFGDLDDGADLVETALLMQGLLIARAYFSGRDDDEAELRETITTLWEEVEWDWFADTAEDGLFWHWSPNHDFTLGLKIQGFNECLVAYILALGSPTHPISRQTYDHWTAGEGYTARDLFGYRVEAALPGGGPLFLTHYSFVGLNPWDMADEFVPGGYYIRNVRQVLGNRAYCLHEAPKENRYGPQFWGLSASLGPEGYAAHDPLHDTGTVAPTAALSSIPYTPKYAFDVLDFLRGKLHADAWGPNGPYDAINLRESWFAGEYLAIDQLPIVSMVENYRSGLLWRLFMAIPEVRDGLAAADIHPPRFATGFPEAVVTVTPAGDSHQDALDLLPHPDAGSYRVPYWSADPEPAVFLLLTEGMDLVWTGTATPEAGRNWLDLPPGLSPKGEILTLTMFSESGEWNLPVRLF